MSKGFEAFRRWDGCRRGGFCMKEGFVLVKGEIGRCIGRGGLV